MFFPPLMSVSFSSDLHVNYLEQLAPRRAVINVRLRSTKFYICCYKRTRTKVNLIRASEKYLTKSCFCRSNNSATQMPADPWRVCLCAVWLFILILMLGLFVFICSASSSIGVTTFHSSPHLMTPARTAACGPTLMRSLQH